MSITSELRASARSAYRCLLRASSSTFKGDERVLRAFREKICSEARTAASSVTDPTAYAAKAQLGREIADILRKNVVQGVRVEGQGEVSEEGKWRLRYTKDTELGSNEDRFGPTSSSSGGGCCQDTNSSADPRASTTAQPSVSNPFLNKEESLYDPEPSSSEPSAFSEQPSPSPSSPTNSNYSALKRQHKERVIPEFSESDIEESFVRGSGPGGQSINKTRNNVQLLHKPSGIRITCQETRSLSQNRAIARKWLLQKLDQQFNPGISKEDMKRAKQRERERRRKKKAVKRRREKEGEVEEDIDEEGEASDDFKK